MVSFLLATGILFREIGKLVLQIIWQELLKPTPAPIPGPEWSDALETASLWAPIVPYLSQEQKDDTWVWFRSHPLRKAGEKIAERFSEEHFELQIAVVRSLKGISPCPSEGLYFSWQAHPETYGTVPYFKGLLSGRYTANNDRWAETCEFVASGEFHLHPIYSIREECGEIYHLAQYFY
jgi:hypothetical protein